MKKAITFILAVLALGGITACTFTGVTPSPVANKVPVAKIAYTNTQNSIGVFDGSYSYDADGVIESYKWDFGDKGMAVGNKVTHVYGKPGVYSVTLTVADDGGASSTCTVQAVINSGFPVADFSYTQTGSMVAFDGSASHETKVTGYTNPVNDGYIMWASWDFGDGTSRSGYCPMAMYATHNYVTECAYQVSLTVKDNEGLANTVYKVIVVNKVNDVSY